MTARNKANKKPNKTIEAEPTRYYDVGYPVEGAPTIKMKIPIHYVEDAIKHNDVNMQRLLCLRYRAATGMNAILWEKLKDHINESLEQVEPDNKFDVQAGLAQPRQKPRRIRI